MNEPASEIVGRWFRAEPVLQSLIVNKPLLVTRARLTDCMLIAALGAYVQGYGDATKYTIGRLGT